MNEKTTQSKDSNNVPESVLLFAGKLGGFSLLLIIPLLVLLFSFDFISSYSSSSTNKSSSSSSNTSCSYSGASSIAKERAGYALSTIKEINSLDMGRVRGMGYDSDYGFLVEGTNNYGIYKILTILISCYNGKYEVDLVDAS